MNDKRQYQKRYALLLMLSVLMHLGAYLGYLASRSVIEPRVPPPRVVVQLSLPAAPETDLEEDLLQPPTDEEADKKSEIEELVVEEKIDPLEPEQHAPVDNSDRFASENQEDRSATEVIAREYAGTNQMRVPDKSADEAVDEGAVKGNQSGSPSFALEQAKGAPETAAEGIETTSLEKKTDTSGDEGKGDTLESSLAPERIFVSSEDGLPQQMSPNTNHVPFVESVHDAMDDGLGEAEGHGTDLPDALAALSIRQEKIGSSAGQDIPEVELPSDFLNRHGNLELLSDQRLREADVPHPFSEQKSKELELANKYLERMNKQVRELWVNPYKGGRMFRGIIKVELNVQGYLENVYVYRASGLNSLDSSVIRAIESVPRFHVPDDEIIAARYYTRMSFHYSSIEAKTELLPFEVELAKKEDS